MSIQEIEDQKQQYLDEMKRLSNSEYRDEIKIPELKENFNGMSIEIRKKEKLHQLEQWANLSTSHLKRFNSFCYDDDEEDYTIAVTPSFPIEEPDNSLSMGDEHLDTISATKSDEFIKSSVENLIPNPSESEGIPELMCDVPFHDNSSPLGVSKDQFEDFLELTPLIPEFETFCFEVEEIISGSTTIHFDISLSEYEALYDDHVKEISSGSPTTHSDSSLYASYIFDLSINPFSPVDRSDFYEFADELIHFISPPEFDCFLFKIEPNSGDFTKDVVEDTSPTKESKVQHALPTHPTPQLHLKFQPSSEYLFTYVVWIFLPFLVYSVAPHYLQSLRNEDTIFDPGICNYHFFSRPTVSHRCGTFPRFKVLNESPMAIFSFTCSPVDQ
uniref:Reverse transcriptase domain-containing protein n=1 Tax=Tanacetum cinerariifolium TaxID=118510 RepID=A0A6L2P8M4_TANCI|nr:hypothetical protein [Tanacetum cinerariifolium]